MNNIRRISKPFLLATTLLPFACTSCFRHDQHYIESSDADSVYLFDWNDSSIPADSNDMARREISFYTDTDLDENEGHLGGYCTFDSEEENMNFCDGESYFSGGDEVSDEEHDEIDEWYGIEE